VVDEPSSKPGFSALFVRTFAVPEVAEKEGLVARLVLMVDNTPVVSNPGFVRRFRIGIDPELTCALRK